MRRTMHSSAAASAISLLALVSAVGCSDIDFERSSEISKFRPLTIVATPPDVAPGETTTLEPVFAYPKSLTPPAHAEWALCVFDEGPNGYFRCAEDIPGLGVSNTLATSTDGTFVYTQDQISNDDLHAACDALAKLGGDIPVPPEIASGLPKCVTGLPVRLRLKVCEEAGCEDKDAHILSSKLTLLFDEYRSRPDRNVAPTMNGLRANDTLLVEGASTPITLQGDEMKVAMRIDVPASAAQSFTPVEPEGANEEREELQMTWFATAGEWKRARSFFREGITTATEIGENELTLKRSELTLPQTIEIWTVLRDSRGGAVSLYREMVVE